MLCRLLGFINDGNSSGQGCLSKGSYDRYHTRLCGLESHNIIMFRSCPRDFFSLRFLSGLHLLHPSES